MPIPLELPELLVLVPIPPVPLELPELLVLVPIPPVPLELPEVLVLVPIPPVPLELPELLVLVPIPPLPPIPLELPELLVLVPIPPLPPLPLELPELDASLPAEPPSPPVVFVGEFVSSLHPVEKPTKVTMTPVMSALGFTHSKNCIWRTMVMRTFLKQTSCTSIVTRHWGKVVLNQLRGLSLRLCRLSPASPLHADGYLAQRAKIH